ncbi:hypothetical protein ALC60_10755 [Trachymyrmex zeteki]|uniref:Uncharacterized protein n=1 Tax=Mycetomoellerius zeteki TaxID=64791 RepID=A0A151WQP3_9HYME|nr:hypothetical protein ALC60_10755 [Trachymyrmex zeteki]
MSSGRKATRPVRQLSLQQPVPRRQHIRRQRSAEDDCSKSLQIYANPIARGRLGANATEKPKVRVAWGDDRHGCDNLAEVEVVARQIPSRSRPTTGRSGRTYATTEKASILYSRQELAERLRLAWKHREQNKANIDIFLAHGMAVEERCDSQLSMSIPSTPLSRKPNTIQDEGKSQQNLIAPSNLRDQEKETHEDHDKGDERLCETKLESAFRLIENNLLTKGDEKTAETMEKEGRDNEKPDLLDNVDIEEEKKKKTRINIDCTNLHLPTTDQSQPSSTFSLLKMENADPAKTNADFSLAKQKRASFHSGTNRAFLVPMVEKSPKGLEAKSKLAPTKSIEIRCASADKTTMRSPIDKNVILTRSSSTASLEKAKRTNSAPPQRRNLASATRVQVNIVIDAPSLADEATDKSIVCEKMQDGKDAVEKYEDCAMKISRGERSIRSAPLKRRSRSAKRRFLASSGPGKDEDRGGRGKAFMDPKTSDVITMVSLVSSADSDSDVENSPGDDKLINELRSKLPTTPIIKTSINPNPVTTRKPIKSDMRKTMFYTFYLSLYINQIIDCTNNGPPSTGRAIYAMHREDIMIDRVGLIGLPVSFQRDSFDEEPTKEEKRISNVQLPRFGLAVNITHGNNSEDVEEQDSRTVIDSVIAIPTLVIEPVLIQKKIVPEAPLTDREKRCLAVPIGDLHDKKRKLLRTRSTPSRPIVAERTINVPMETKEQRISLAIPRVDLVAIPAPSIDTSLLKVEQFPKETIPAKETPPEVILPSEPHFQTTKEKECWHLYRRMCDKGVCVSFDTVLR